MNIFKRIFTSKKKKATKEEKKTECWYNNAHENGEAVRGSVPLEAGGSANLYEAALTESCVRK